MKPFIASVVQWTPVVHDPIAGAARAVEAIRLASKRGAKLVVFPETWLQGYPYWAGLSQRDPEYHAFREVLFKQAITIPHASLDPIRKAAAQAQATVVIGLHERAGGTLYNTLLYIGSDGKLLGRHRKLMPTTTERLVWGMGDGSDLEAYDTPQGRLGGLICFEHQMAPARYVLADMGVQIHASVWPGHAELDPIIDAATRHLATENGCFVLVAREVMSAAAIPAGMPVRKSDEGWQTHGGSAIIAPGGAYLAGPVFDEETILTAEIDLDKIALTKWWNDATGHYARPDVFRVTFDRSPKPPVIVTGSAAPSLSDPE